MHCLGVFDNGRGGVVIGAAAMRNHEVRFDSFIYIFFFACCITKTYNNLWATELSVLRMVVFISIRIAVVW